MKAFALQHFSLHISDLVMTCPSRNHDIEIIYVCQNIHERRLHVLQDSSIPFMQDRISSRSGERGREAEGQTIAALHPRRRDFVSIDSAILHVFCAV